MTSENIAQAYNRWAPVYDLVFGSVFRQGRSAAIEVAERIGGAILEVGVGTGISLPGYSPDTRVTGVDISADMLEKARRRVHRLGLGNVERLELGDAEALAFPDCAFDVVVAQYVVSAVACPERALDEFARVCRPGGEIVITTRVGAEDGLRNGIEKALMPLTTGLGFRTDFPFARYADWIRGRGDVALIERRDLPPLGHFSLVRIAKLPARVEKR